MTDATVEADETATTHGDAHDDHHEHRSVWPVVGAAGATGLYVGIALVVLAVSTGMLPVALGGLVAFGGFGGLVAGLVGWTREAFLADYASRAVDTVGQRSYRATMILFLVTDLGTFGAGFIYYFYVRAAAWPPEHLPHLVGSLVAINTVILLASSATIHYAHHALHEGDQRRFQGLLGATLALGVVFLAGQVFEYYEFIVVEGFTITDGVFGSAFYGLTGLHGLHVTLGAVLLGILFLRARQGHYTPERDTSVTTVSLYWHFVDVVWVFLVAVLYVGAAF